GTVQIADQSFTLTQHGSPCSYSLSPTNRTHGAGAATNFVALTTTNGCAWDVINSNSWLAITSPTNGADSATINYTVEANPSVLDRVAVVVIAGEVFTLTQRGVPCAFDVAPSNRTHGNGATTNSFAVSTQDGCAWNVANTNS